MKIAVVILNWNGKNLLEKFLPSVLNHSPEANIYVADNASTDDSIQYVKANFPSIGIITNASNGGYAKGYNDALADLSEDIFALVNSDVEVTKGWLGPILKEFKASPITGIIQPKIMDYNSPLKFEYAGAAGGHIDRYGFPYCRGRIFNHLEVDNGQYNFPSPIFWASGACFFIRATVFKELKGFDEDYFAHQEEIDLCWRAFNSGVKSTYIPSSVVFHVGGATLAQTNPQKTYLNFRNSLFSILKNAPGRKLWRIIVMRLFLDGIAGIKFILELKFSHFWAVIRAHFSFYGHIPRLLKKRKEQKMKRPNYFNNRSIVWQYFIERRRFYRDLRT